MAGNGGEKGNRVQAKGETTSEEAKPGKNKFAELVESRRFQVLVGSMLVLNALIVGAQTYPLESGFALALDLLDRAILLGFTVELVMRFLASRPKLSYFKDPWNLFDLAVVSISYVPLSAYLSAIRVVRVLRILRAISTSPVLRKLLTALGRSLLPMGHLALLLTIIVYTYAVIGTYLFGAIDPAKFGTLHGSVLTLFTVLTLEGWPDVMRGVMDPGPGGPPGAPWAWVYFVSFLFVGTYITMNFVIGIIVNTLNELGKEDEAKEDVRETGQGEMLKRIEEKLDRLEKALVERGAVAPPAKDAPPAGG